MQQGRQLSDVKRDTSVRQVGRGFVNILSSKDEDKQKDILKQNKDAIQLTPEEQEMVKKIEGKAGKARFRCEYPAGGFGAHPRAGGSDSVRARKCLYTI